MDENTVNKKEDHEQMAGTLSLMLEEGKGSVPSLPEPLVCKPKQIESWRIFRIMSEFVEGFDLLRKYTTAVTVFGGTRHDLSSEISLAATALSEKLSKKGFAIITGGSSGIMAAANRGAHNAQGASIGLNIRLPMSQSFNEYLTDQMIFDHFFVRKTMLSFASEVYIFFPGGFGTMDEFFEILTLVQTQKIRKIPIVLYGSAYWNPLIQFMKEKMFDELKAIDEADMNLFVVFDDINSAYEYIISNVKC